MARSARVGALLVAGLLLFLVAVFVLANSKSLLSRTRTINTEFYNVSGLLTGSNVQYQGYNVGRVERITLPSRAGGKIRVEMKINDAAAHLIRANTRAQIQSDGLVGNQIITLVANPVAAPQVNDNGRIEGIEPFSIAAVTDRALESADRLDAITETVGLIVQDVRNGEGSLGRVLYDPALYNSLNRTTATTEELVATLNQQAVVLSATAQRVAGTAEEATQNLNLTIQNLNRRADGVMVNLDGTVANLNSKLDSRTGTVGRFLNDDAVYEQLLATADSLRGLSTSVRAVARNAEELSAWGALGAFRFAELMEAGKHNFLFKGYFERRGYQEQAPFEIRERAIRATQQEIEQRQRELLEYEQRLRARAAAQGTPLDSLRRN